MIATARPQEAPPAQTPAWQAWADAHPLAAQVLGLAALVLACALLTLAIRGILLPVVRRAIERSRFEWDDAFVDSRFFRWLSLIVPALVARYGVAAVPHVQDSVVAVVENIAAAVTALAAMLAFGALLNAINAIYARRQQARDRPIKGYVQIVKIFVYVIGTILVLCNLFGQDPGLLLGGLGAMSAVLMLIFKDTILSLVASIQLTSNDMVRVGDWIEMPKYAADGDVIDIALHTVKVQNWDKTITTIPTYALISESYRNWRGMKESGGRRIKRNLHIDVTTIRFLDDADLERFGEFALLREYIARKRRELEEHNRGAGADSEVGADVRRLTNIGTLRAYIEAYLRRHPQVHPEMTFLVRQLQPTQDGLPIEIYIFTRTTDWREYEAIQADIFDHILAIVPEFGLAVFQRPAARDVAQAAAALGVPPAGGP